MTCLYKEAPAANGARIAPIEGRDVGEFIIFIRSLDHYYDITIQCYNS